MTTGCHHHPDPERLHEIRARLQAATNGPWEWREWACGDQAITGPDNTGFVVNIDSGTSEADARLIARAPEDIAWLLAQLEARCACTDNGCCQNAGVSGDD